MQIWLSKRCLGCHRTLGDKPGSFLAPCHCHGTREQIERYWQEEMRDGLLATMPARSPEPEIFETAAHRDCFIVSGRYGARVEVCGTLHGAAVWFSRLTWNGRSW